uniref:Disease resistance R13L4/SHOC-2-like LRR domain-containing protein n=1 Tax=Oryza barthii TaxID=65489 RepID=A0A0D3H4L3_9ORYZ
MCLLYFSIFPALHGIRRRRLVMRWIAEGYSSASEVGERDAAELISMGMIHPSNKADIKNCFYSVSRRIHAMLLNKYNEENLILVLDDSPTSSINKWSGRHLTVRKNWKRSKNELLRTVDLSRLQSLTVFGEWNSFLISDDMRALVVLDLEDTSGVRDEDLKYITKLINLKYLSLRECNQVSHLPDSVGHLRHLQTLDVRETGITTLPRSIVTLKLLQFLRASTKLGGEERRSNRFSLKKLMNLRTLGVISLEGECGKSMLKDLKELTGLRKLEVGGISERNFRQFCEAVVDLEHLQSLSIWSHQKNPSDPRNFELFEDPLSPAPSRLDRFRLHGRLQWMLPSCVTHSKEDDSQQNFRRIHLSPPRNLQSLRLRGELKLPIKWMLSCFTILKLSLIRTSLSEDDIAELGHLPQLSTLRLGVGSIDGGSLTFKSGSFPSLRKLHLDKLNNLKSVKFQQGTSPNLEILVVDGSQPGSTIQLSGTNGFKVVLRNCKQNTMDGLEAQPARNEEQPLGTVEDIEAITNMRDNEEAQSQSNTEQSADGKVFSALGCNRAQKGRRPFGFKIPVRPHTSMFRRKVGKYSVKHSKNQTADTVEELEAITSMHDNEEAQSQSYAEKQVDTDEELEATGNKQDDMEVQSKRNAEQEVDAVQEPKARNNIREDVETQSKRIVEQQADSIQEPVVACSVPEDIEAQSKRNEEQQKPKVRGMKSSRCTQSKN